MLSTLHSKNMDLKFVCTPYCVSKPHDLHVLKKKKSNKLKAKLKDSLIISVAFLLSSTCYGGRRSGL